MRDKLLELIKTKNQPAVSLDTLFLHFGCTPPDQDEIDALIESRKGVNVRAERQYVEPAVIAPKKAVERLTDSQVQLLAMKQSDFKSFKRVLNNNSYKGDCIIGEFIQKQYMNPLAWWPGKCSIIHKAQKEGK